jgi:uncharacterized protein YqjF (DUF2071 family)
MVQSFSRTDRVPGYGETTMTPFRALDSPTLDDARQRWVWSQHWLDVIFLHWRVPASSLRLHLPAALEVDTKDGAGWASLVLFRLRVRPRGLPFLPGLSTLFEANLRTYVRFQGRSGIWFLSVLADNAWAIRAARWLTPMPYEGANITYTQEQGRYQFDARPQAPLGGHLTVSLVPEPAEQPVADGTLDAWLLERYRLYVSDRRRGLVQAQVSHCRWTYSRAQLLACCTNLGCGFGLDFAQFPDRIHFARGVAAWFGPFRKVALE